MPHTRKKKKYFKQQKIETISTPKEKGDIKAIAACLIMAINDNYITYRQFKEIQAMIDEKFDKPSWAIKRGMK